MNSNSCIEEDLLVSIVPRVDSYKVAVRVISPVSLHFFCCWRTKIDTQRRCKVFEIQISENVYKILVQSLEQLFWFNSIHARKSIQLVIINTYDLFNLYSIYLIAKNEKTP